MIEESLILVILIQYSQKHTTINHCDRGITHPSDTDTVQSKHTTINHCDRGITHHSDTDTVQSKKPR